MGTDRTGSFHRRESEDPDEEDQSSSDFKLNRAQREYSRRLHEAERGAESASSGHHDLHCSAILCRRQLRSAAR